MRLLRRTIAAVLGLAALSFCVAPSRADQYYGSSTVRSIGTGTETVAIKSSVLGSESGLTFYSNYQTTLATSNDGGVTFHNATTYSTFCVDLMHSATGVYSALSTPSPPLTSSYSGGSGDPNKTTVPGTLSDNSFGNAAWLVNQYNSGATNSDQQAGLQIAIWKVLYEKAGNYALNAGSITFSGETAGALSAATKYISGWLMLVVPPLFPLPTS